MKVKLACFAVGVCLLAAVTSCSKSSPAAPVAPSATAKSGTDANADGSTLKVAAPTLSSPANGSSPGQGGDSIALVVNNAPPKYGNAPTTYRFQVFSPGGQLVADGQGIVPGATTTSYNVSTSNLEGDQPYTWWSRIEYQGETGPWSTKWSFIAPSNDGYIRGNELYDPLVNGKSVGQIAGPTTFIPNVGLRFHAQLSLVTYTLQQTLTEGEFSMLITGMNTNTDGDKTKMFSMAEGYDDIVTNNRRFTVEKRGDPAGEVAWRFITHDDQIDTVGPERQTVNFDANQIYFWQATWRGNRFRLLIQRGGVGGQTVYDMSKPFAGRAYDPSPHVAYLGAPPGRSGESGASVDNVTYRQIWISARPRPAFANK